MSTEHDNVHDKLGNWSVCTLVTNISDKQHKNQSFIVGSCEFTVAWRRKEQVARLQWQGISLLTQNKKECCENTKLSDSQKIQGVSVC
jgi:hypothetical protein